MELLWPVPVHLEHVASRRFVSNRTDVGRREFRRQLGLAAVAVAVEKCTLPFGTIVLQPRVLSNGEVLRHCPTIQVVCVPVHDVACGFCRIPPVFFTRRVLPAHSALCAVFSVQLKLLGRTQIWVICLRVPLHNGAHAATNHTWLGVAASHKLEHF